MRRSLSSASLFGVFAFLLIAVPSQGEDFLPLLLRKPVPTLLDPRGCSEERERESGMDAALLWRRMTLLDEHGRFNSRGLLEAIQQRQAHVPPGHPGPHTVAGNGLKAAPNTLYPYNWVSRGPVNQGGRTRAILVHPTNSQIIYAGAATGGVWVSSNGGTSWFPLTDQWANTAISTLAFDAGNNPSIIYAGTGESPYSYNEAVYGVGVLKSMDGGYNWAQLPVTTGWSPIQAMAAQPNVNGVVLAGTNDGIYRLVYNASTGQTTASKVYPTTASAFNMFIFGIQFDSTGNNAVAFGQWMDQNPHNFAAAALYSTDGGQTFNLATTPTPTPGAWNAFWGSYAPGSPNIVYAHRPPLDMLKSTDGGHTYSALPTLTSQICYDSRICTMWVSPTNSSLVVIGGTDLWRSPDPTVTNSFTRISNWGLSLPGGSEPHADQHAIVSSPANSSVVFVGNDGGVYKAADINQVYSQSTYWSNLNSGYVTTQFYNAVGNATGNALYLGGTQDSGTMVTSPVTVFSPYRGPNEAWRPIGGDGGYAAIDPSPSYYPFYLYGETQALRNCNSNCPNWPNTCDNCPFSPQPYRSTNGGQTSAWIGSTINEPSTDPNPGANFVPPMIQDPNTPGTLYVGGGRLWKTTNAELSSPTWTSIRNGSAFLPGSGFLPFISAIAVAPGNSNIIWVGLDDGRIDRTTNGGATWNWIDNDTFPNPLPDRYVTSIFIDPANSNVVYVTFGGFATNNIWRTADGGSTWTNIQSNLPAAPYRSITRHPRNPQQLYVGGDVGAWSSADGGSTWITSQEGPADVQVDSISFSYGSTDQLMAGTHGRGMWSADVSDVPTLAPSGLVATANGTTSVSVSWNGVTGGTVYNLLRSNDGGAYFQIAAVTTTSYTDSSVVSGKTYLYKVNTTVNSVPTLFSNVDLATTVTFTDDNNLLGKPVLATHLQEIRTAVNLVRAAGALAPLSFSPAAAPGVAIASTDITNLRSGLVSAYTAIGMPSPPSFAESVYNGVTIKASHYQEIRNAVK